MTHGGKVAAAVAVVGVDLLWPAMVAAANKARVARVRTRAADILKLNLNSKWRLFTLHSHTHTHTHAQWKKCGHICRNTRNTHTWA